MATIKGYGRIYDNVLGYNVAKVNGKLETFESRVIELAKDQGFEVVEYVAKKVEPIGKNKEK
jgi:hypothetical protein